MGYNKEFKDDLCDRVRTDWKFRDSLRCCDGTSKVFRNDLLSESKVTWPSMVTHTQNLCSAFNPSKVHRQSSEHIHNAVAPREQLGVRCLA